MINLDHQAGAPLLPEAREAMRPFLDAPCLPSSLHGGGLRAREALEKAREQVAALVGGRPEGVLFTSGGTESANLALRGYARANASRGRHLLVGATEHAAVLRSAERLEAEGFAVSLVPVDEAGRLRRDELDRLARPDTILLAVHAANHEIGTLPPLPGLAAWCRERGIALFRDACAAAGAVPLSVDGVALLSLSPARFGGPQGVGVLYRAPGTALEPLLVGGNQEQETRAGSENVAGIAGAGAAAGAVASAMPERTARLAAVQRALWKALQAQVPGVRLNGPDPGPERNPANLHVSIEGVEGEGLALLCDLNGLALASGAACVSRDLRVSHVLKAIGLSADRAFSSATLTWGPETTEAEAERAAAIVAKAAAKLRAMSPRTPRAPRD